MRVRRDCVLAAAPASLSLPILAGSWQNSASPRSGPAMSSPELNDVARHPASVRVAA